MLERRLAAETVEHADALDNYFARARAVILLTANSPGFANVLAEPGTREDKVRRQSRNIAEVTHQMRYLETLYPKSIGEACFIDRNGAEFARVVRGDVAPASDLSTEEKQTVFFRPTFALRFGQVHQTHPYISPDTREWVVANASLIPQADGHKRAFVHFEVTVESFRRAMAAATGFDDGVDLRVIDARSGRVIIDGTHPQRVGEPLGEPADRRFATLARTAATPASPRSRAGRPPTGGSRRAPATPTTGSSSPPRRHRPRRSSRAWAWCRSRCSRWRC